MPSGFSSKIKSILGPSGEIEEAFAPMSVTMTLEDEIDISRGDMIVRKNNQPEQKQDLEAMLCWMDNKALVPNGKYALRHTSADVRCMVQDVLYKVDINTLHRNEEDRNIGMNDIARVKIRTTKPLHTDSYKQNRHTGSFVLIDEGSNNTVAAGMII